MRTRGSSATVPWLKRCLLRGVHAPIAYLSSFNLRRDCPHGVPAATALPGLCPGFRSSAAKVYWFTVFGLQELRAALMTSPLSMVVPRVNRDSRVE